MLLFFEGFLSRFWVWDLFGYCKLFLVWGGVDLSLSVSLSLSLFLSLSL